MTRSTRARCRRRDTCRICRGRALERVLSFGETPLANAFLREDELDAPEERYPLDVWLCGTCGLLQLLDVVDPEILFRDYVYVSSTSETFVEHFRRYAADVVAAHRVPVGSLVVEIGSNDGVLLRPFKALGMRVLGVDPAVGIAREATAGGIETLPRFFTPDLAAEIVATRGTAAVVAANNVFAHVDDLHAMVEGIVRLLAPDGVFVFEVSYLLDVHEKTLFDMTYHEHLCYHTVRALRALFAPFGLELVDAIRVPTHGGSLRGVVRRGGGPDPPRESVAALSRLEAEVGLERAETWRRFGERIANLKRELRTILLDLKAGGRRIAGFGAPAKMTTLMHHFEIGADLVEFVVDDSPLKQGLFTPGHRVPVLPVSELYRRRPDDTIIMAWNFAPSIVARHRAYLERGGRFIVPLPRVEILGPA